LVLIALYAVTIASSAATAPFLGPIGASLTTDYDFEMVY